METLEAINKRASLKRIHLHDLRHTYAALQRKYCVSIKAKVEFGVGLFICT